MVTTGRRGAVRATARDLRCIHNLDAFRERGNVERTQAWKCRNYGLPTPEKVTLEPLTTALRLVHRRSEPEDANRRPGGIRVTEERELYRLKDGVQKYPAAVRAILDASRRLHRSVDARSERDIETN